LQRKSISAVGLAEGGRGKEENETLYHRTTSPTPAVDFMGACECLCIKEFGLYLGLYHLI
jgi:hypothetical protein